VKAKLIVVACFVFAACPAILAQVNLTQNLKMYLPFTGNVADASGNGNVVTVSGATLITDRFGAANSAYHFDGVNDFMSIVNGAGMKPTYPFSFSCWIKIISSNPQVSVNHVYNNDYTIPGTNYDGAIFNVPVTGIWQASVGDGGPTNPSNRRTKATNQIVPFGTWHHIAAVVNSATSMKLYIDCAEVPGSYSGTGSGLVYTPNGQGMIARGNGGGGENYLNADLDEMRFYDRALTDQEIIALYYFPNQPSPLNVNLGPDTTVCQGTSVQLNAGISGATYLWSTGQTSQTINVTNPGTYWVSVNNACSLGFDTVVVSTITSPPLSANLPSNITHCTNLGPLILDAGNPGANYLWSTGANSQTILANSSGTYSVTVSNACSTVTDVVSVNLATLPAISVNLGNDTTICWPTILHLNASFQGGGTYLWSTGHIGPTINVLNSGTYWVQISNGCYTDRDTIVVTSSQDPPVVIDLGNDTTYCQAQQVTLTAGPAGNNYLWSTGATTPSITVSTSGTYFVVGQNTCSLDRDTIAIQFSVEQTLNVNLGHDTAICQGTSVQLNAGILGATYLWSTGQTSQTINVSTPGTYWVNVSNACAVGGDTVVVSINQDLPIIINLGDDSTYCQIQQLTLTAGPAGNNYLWSTGAITPSITVNQSGTYFVIGQNTCNMDMDTVTVQFSVGQPVNVNLGNDTTICPNSPQIILDAGNPGNAYVWNDNTTGQTHAVTAPGLYFVTVSNACYTDSDSITINFVNAQPVVLNLGPDIDSCVVNPSSFV
jgi:hypothetical protein